MSTPSGQPKCTYLTKKIISYLVWYNLPITYINEYYHPLIGAIQILSNPFTNFSNMTNTQALGSVLYTDYILYFQLSGVILLVAMIGSIVLTLRDRTGVRRQVIGEQLERDSSSTVLIEVESGEGVDI